MADHKKAQGALPVGTILSSGKQKYRIEKILGTGGFGITYLVERIEDGHYMAMKEFFPDIMCERGEDNTMSYLKTNADEIEMGIDNFITEANRLNDQKISHPNIVEIDEVFKANNTAYYVMEYIDGQTLSQYIKSKKGKPLTPEQTLDVMRPVLKAVSVLHKNKITHLDIKHDNILLTVDDDNESFRPVLIDFGQSKHYDKKGRATSKLTNAGCSEGFAPQEQYLGLTEFTPQADIYALCATMLYLLTAKQPVKSSEMTASKIIGMLDENIPENIKEALIDGMRSNKNDRIKDVAELARKLEIDLSNQNHEGSVTRLLDLSKVKKKKKAVKEKEEKKKDNVTTRIDLKDIEKLKEKDTEKVEEAKEIDGSVDKKPILDSYKIKKFGLAAVLVSGVVAGFIIFNRWQRKEVNTQNEDIIAENVIEPAQPDSAITEMSEIVADENTPREESKTQESDDELFAKASQNGDFNTLLSLSNKGYAKAYYPLANIYFNRGNNPSAKSWAQKSVSANVNVSQAKALLAKINAGNASETSNQPTTAQQNQSQPGSGNQNAQGGKPNATVYDAVDNAALAEKALATRNYKQADAYAKKAIASGNSSQKSKGNSVINSLKILGYYDDQPNQPQK